MESLKIMQSIGTFIIVVYMLSMRTEASESIDNGSNSSLDTKNLLKRNGEAADQQSSVDANTQALWEAYWKQYPENAWDATPNYYNKGKRGN